MAVADVGVFEVYAGDPWVQGFAFGTEADPEDISAYTWSCEWRQEAEATAFIELSVDDSDAANGNLTISATAEQTRLMGRSGVFDVEGSPGPVTRLRGRTSWMQDVTRG